MFRIEPPITEHVFISSNIFQYFTHSLTKLSDFCIIGLANLKGYKCSLSIREIRSEGVMQKTQDEDE
jgi:hypothetical protein